MNKVALLVGHSDKDPGANGVEPINMTEHDFNTNLAQALAGVLQKKFDVKIFFRIGTTKTQFYEFVSSWKPDVSLELHFNSSDNKEAFGTETLCAVASRVFAQIMQESMCKALGRHNHGGDRGIKVLKPKDRGYLNVNSLRCPNVLLEPFFGSNSTDCSLMLSKVEDFCLALDTGISHYLSLS